MKVDEIGGKEIVVLHEEQSFTLIHFLLDIVGRFKVRLFY